MQTLPVKKCTSDSTLSWNLWPTPTATFDALFGQKHRCSFYPTHSLPCQVCVPTLPSHWVLPSPGYNRVLSLSTANAWQPLSLPHFSPRNLLRPADCTRQLVITEFLPQNAASLHWLDRHLLLNIQAIGKLIVQLGRVEIFISQDMA